MDWEPYIEDIVAFYVGEDKTVNETIEHLYNKHGLNVT